jgi:hypothetical protein
MSNTPPDPGPEGGAALDFFPGETAQPGDTRAEETSASENVVYDDPSGSMFSGRSLPSVFLLRFYTILYLRKGFGVSNA